MQVASPDFDGMFGALADHTRRDIVRRAITAEEGIVELASHYPMSFAAVQKPHRHPRTSRPGHQGARRAPQGRPHQSGAAARRATVARPVRGALARPHRPHGRIDFGNQGEPTVTVTAVRKDPQRLTMTIEAEFDASPERVWQLWADPRQLERWWGPLMYPATFTKHDLALGSRVEYQMTGPKGDQLGGRRGRYRAWARLPRRFREGRRHVEY
jgi:hypothetical protein